MPKAFEGGRYNKANHEANNIQAALTVTNQTSLALATINNILALRASRIQRH